MCREYFFRNKVVAGIVFSSPFHYKLRLSLETTDVEAKTNSLFSPTIVYIVPKSCYFRGRWFDRFIVGGNDEDQHGETWGTKESICTEARYRLFSIVQSVVDNAILWNKGKKSTFLPTSDDELCSDEMV